MATNDVIYIQDYVFKANSLVTGIFSRGRKKNIGLRKDSKIIKCDVFLLFALLLDETSCNVLRLF